MRNVPSECYLEQEAKHLRLQSDAKKRRRSLLSERHNKSKAYRSKETHTIHQQVGMAHCVLSISIRLLRSVPIIF